MTTAIDRAKQHSNRTLEALRQRLTPVAPESESIVTCGSYARREASAESDIDFFIITKQSASTQEGEIDASKFPWLAAARDAISEIVPIEPAEGGAFSKLESEEAMLLNIGGDYDSNQKI